MPDVLDPQLQQELERVFVEPVKKAASKTTNVLWQQFINAMKNASKGSNAIAQWIEKGGKVSTVSIANDLADAAREECAALGIPFLSNMGKTMTQITVRDIDGATLDKINQHLEATLGRGSTEMSPTDLIEFMQKGDFLDKNVISLDGLSLEEIESLKDQLSQGPGGKQGAYVHMAMEDGTHSLIVPAEQVVNDIQEISDYPQAYLEMALQQYGPGGSNLKAKLTNELEFDKDFYRTDAFREKINEKTPEIYIVDKERQDRYIKITGEGYRTVSMETVDGKLTPVEGDLVSAEDLNYAKSLQKEMRGWQERTLVTDQSTLNRHLHASTLSISPLAPSVNDMQRLSNVGESKLAAQMDQLIKSHIRYNPRWINGNGLEKMNLYKNEALHILHALKKGELFTSKYQSNELKPLYSIASAYQLSMKDYTSSINRLNKMEARYLTAEKAISKGTPIINVVTTLAEKAKEVAKEVQKAMEHGQPRTIVRDSGRNDRE